MGTGREKNGGKSTGNKRHNWQAQNRQGEGKNSMGNGEAKELTCMTQGHEFGGDAGGNGDAWQRGRKGRKNGAIVIAKSIY